MVQIKEIRIKQNKQTNKTKTLYNNGKCKLIHGERTSRYNVHHRQRERQTDRYTETQRERERDRQADRQTDREQVK